MSIYEVIGRVCFIFLICSQVLALLVMGNAALGVVAGYKLDLYLLLDLTVISCGGMIISATIMSIARTLEMSS